MRGRDIDIILRHEADPRYRVEVIYLRNLFARRRGSFDIRYRRHHADVPQNLAGSEVIWMVVAWGMCQNNIWTGTAHEIQEIQPCRFSGKEKLVRVVHPDELCSNHSGRGESFQPALLRNSSFGERGGPHLSVGRDR